MPIFWIFQALCWSTCEARPMQVNINCCHLHRILFSPLGRISCSMHDSRFKNLIDRSLPPQQVERDSQDPSSWLLFTFAAASLVVFVMVGVVTIKLFRGHSDNYRVADSICTVNHLSDRFSVKVSYLFYEDPGKSTTESKYFVELDPEDGKFHVASDQTYYLFFTGKHLIVSCPLPSTSSSPPP